jgi:ribosomal protein L44E
MKKKFRFERKINVYCKQCERWMDENTVKFVDICEDDRGRDLLTFECSNCDTTQKSLRVG